MKLREMTSLNSTIEMESIIADYLKKNLEVKVKVDTNKDRINVDVELKLNGKQIAYDYDSDSLPTTS